MTATFSSVSGMVQHSVRSWSSQSELFCCVPDILVSDVTCLNYYLSFIYVVGLQLSVLSSRTYLKLDVRICLKALFLFYHLIHFDLRNTFYWRTHKTGTNSNKCQGQVHEIQHFIPDFRHAISLTHRHVNVIPVLLALRGNRHKVWKHY